MNTQRALCNYPYMRRDSQSSFHKKKGKGEPKFCMGLIHIPFHFPRSLCGSWFRAQAGIVLSRKNPQTLIWEVLNGSEVNVEYMCCKVATVF